MNPVRTLRRLALALPVALIATPAMAMVTTTSTLTFDTILAALGGQANVAPVAGGNCPGSGFSGCYYEDGMAFGTLLDPSNPIAHVHGGNGEVAYHSDAPGVFLRAIDGTAFALVEMDFHAPISDENPDSGAAELWEILGFNVATDATLTVGDGTNYATRVAYQTVANGFDGTLALDAAFGNVNAVWIHYNGYPLTPTDGKEFEVMLDNIVVAAPVPLAPMPLPALVAMAGGLIGWARRNRNARSDTA